MRTVTITVQEADTGVRVTVHDLESQEQDIDSEVSSAFFSDVREAAKFCTRFNTHLRNETVFSFTTSDPLKHPGKVDLTVETEKGETLLDALQINPSTGIEFVQGYLFPGVKS